MQTQTYSLTLKHWLQDLTHCSLFQGPMTDFPALTGLGGRDWEGVPHHIEGVSPPGAGNDRQAMSEGSKTRIPTSLYPLPTQQGKRRGSRCGKGQERNLVPYCKGCCQKLSPLSCLLSPLTPFPNTRFPPQRATRLVPTVLSLGPHPSALAFTAL